MKRAIAWIGIYFFIPLLPFLIGGITKFYIANKILHKEFVFFSLETIYANYDFLTLIFAIALIGILLEQNIRNYKPPIPTDPVDKNPIVFCRIIYIVNFILWGLLFAATEFNKLNKELDYNPFLNIIKFISLLFLLFTFLLIVLAQSQYKFKIQ